MIRVQDECGHGMYQRDTLNRNMSMDYDRHPMPHMDSLLREVTQENYCLDDHYERKKFHYGFKDLDQLHNWLYNDDILRALHDDGYRVVTLANGEFYYGHTQAIAVIGSYDIIETNNLIDF